ncbi:hypothetical protein Fmac_003205 [Flemingia macrophylla]|uniref:Ribose-5-phosphate isomerase n=1 Tax=Flemingia macrophylla TaxID=520843 RepID=A0ABD1NQ25_9FABA
MAAEGNRRTKIIAAADDFGSPLKDALVAHLRSLQIQVEDLGTSSYYSAEAEVGRRVSQSSIDHDHDVRGLVACGTGAGVSIFANKFPAVYAATCLSPSDAVNARSINNSNVLTVSGKSTSSDAAVEIPGGVGRRLFKAGCPANDGKAWPEEI